MVSPHKQSLFGELHGASGDRRSRLASGAVVLWPSAGEALRAPAADGGPELRSGGETPC